MVIKIGQRWVMRSSCHSFIVEIVEVIDAKYGVGKIIQLLSQSNTCNMATSTGRRTSVYTDNSDWDYLVGQDAP